MTIAASRPESANELSRLRQELARCRRGQEAMALGLLSACQALNRTRQALLESQERESQARQRGARDVLTGLPNRAAFGPRSDRTLARHAQAGRGFGLLFVDLDGFKSVNDRFGHAAGDALLAIVGARLVHALRQDDFVSRHGGDEFVCLLPEITEDAQALALADKLREAVRAPCRVGGHTLRVYASVGIALYPRDGRSIAAMLEHADREMLRSKSRGAGAGLGGPSAGPGSARAGAHPPVAWHADRPPRTADGGGGAP